LDNPKTPATQDDRKQTKTQQDTHRTPPRTRKAQTTQARHEPTHKQLALIT